MILSSYFWLIDNHPSYTLYNFIVSLVASTLMQLGSMGTLYIVTGGKAAICSAIINSNCLFTTLLFFVISAVTPSIMQFTGMMVTIFGITIFSISK